MNICSCFWRIVTSHETFAFVSAYLNSTACQFYKSRNSRWSETNNMVPLQFSLVCSRAVYQPLYQLSYTIASVIGALAFGWLPQKFVPICLGSHRIERVLISKRTEFHLNFGKMYYATPDWR